MILQGYTCPNFNSKNHLNIQISIFKVKPWRPVLPLNPNGFPLEHRKHYFSFYVFQVFLYFKIVFSLDAEWYKDVIMCFKDM